MIFAVLLLPLSYIAAKIISHFYFDPRPFVVGNFTPLIPHAADNGFPSDHTLLGAAIAFAIFRFNKKLGLLLLFFAILVGFSRVLAGVHHASDIAGSIVIAGVDLSALDLCQSRLLADFPEKGIILRAKKFNKAKTKTKTRRTVIFYFLLFLMAGKFKYRNIYQQNMIQKKFEKREDRKIFFCCWYFFPDSYCGFISERPAIDSGECEQCRSE